MKQKKIKLSDYFKFKIPMFGEFWGTGFIEKFCEDHGFEYVNIDKPDGHGRYLHYSAIKKGDVICAWVKWWNGMPTDEASIRNNYEEIACQIVYKIERFIDPVKFPCPQMGPDGIENQQPDIKLIHWVEQGVNKFLSCIDPKVKQVWFVGGKAPNWTEENPICEEFLEILFYNGHRKNFKSTDFSGKIKDLSVESVHDAMIQAANEYLEDLNSAINGPYPTKIIHH